MNPQDKQDMVPDWKLERYLLGELDPGNMEMIEREAERNQALRARLEAMRQSDREILDRYPAGTMGRGIRGRLKRSEVSAAGVKSGFRSRLWPVPAIPALAVVLLIAILPALFPPGIDETGNGGAHREIRLKGTGARLLLHRRTDSGSERLENGSLAREGDLIMVQYNAGGKEYGVILSIDGRGTIIRHFPREGLQAGQLESTGPVTLGFSYELDDAPGWEQFYFITSDSPFEIDTVVEAARRKAAEMTGSGPGSLDLPDRFEQYLFILRKEDGHDS